eukprot:scaffold33961_cov61-Phaeocystis_antarctica.AAC.2
MQRLTSEEARGDTNGTNPRAHTSACQPETSHVRDESGISILHLPSPSLSRSSAWSNSIAADQLLKQMHLLRREQIKIGSASLHGGLRRSAGRGAPQDKLLEVEPERGQCAAEECRDEGGAAGVSDLGVIANQRTCKRWRRRHKGGEALVTKQIAHEIELFQRGQPPQGRREGHQPRVADGGLAQSEVLEPRQGASAQSGGKRRGACVAHVQIVDSKRCHGRQRTCTQPRHQPLHAVERG